MAEELKALIDKINEEAVSAAHQKAKAIEDEAALKAKHIIEEAKKRAENIIEAAKKETAGMEESAKASIKQAGRDLILSLRKEINALLGRIIISHVDKTMTCEEMVSVIASLVKDCRTGEKGAVVVSLRKEDLARIEKSLLGQLGDEVKKGLTLKVSDDIRAGFTISYDKGKSYYDFTDEAIAGYLGNYLRPKLKEFLKG